MYITCDVEEYHVYSVTPGKTRNERNHPYTFLPHDMKVRDNTCALRTAVMFETWDKDLGLNASSAPKISCSFTTTKCPECPNLFPQLAN